MTTSVDHSRIFTLSSLQLLQHERVIPELPGSPSDLWETGRAFVEAKTNGNPVHGAPLYTCDTSGNDIASEIGPLM